MAELIIEDLGRFIRVYPENDPRPLMPSSVPPVNTSKWDADAWARWEEQTRKEEEEFHAWHARARVYDLCCLKDRDALRKLGITR